MAEVYARGAIGNEWIGILENFQDAELSVEGATLEVHFRKPDGTILVRAGENKLDDDDTSNDMEISYVNVAPSILDQVGQWAYTVAAKFSDGRFIKSPYWKRFWVTD